MKKIIIRVCVGFFSFILFLAIVTVSLFWNEIRSLASIEKLDDYGMLQMRYYGDYGFDDFLKVGAENDRELEAFVTKRLLKGLPINLGGSRRWLYSIRSPKREWRNPVWQKL